MTPTPTPQPILIEMVGGASFWDSPLFISGLTLAGVLAGYLLTFYQQKRQTDIQLRQRFFDNVLEYSSQMVSAADSMRDIVIEIQYYLGLIGPIQNRNSSQQRINELDEAFHALHDELARARSSLMLVAPKPIRDCAVKLYKTVDPIFKVERTVETVSAASHELFHANSALQEAVRKQFNVNN